MENKQINLITIENGFFNKKECEAIVSRYLAINPVSASLTGDMSARNSHNNWIYRDFESSWIFSRIDKKIFYLNEFFKFDLDIDQKIDFQITQYIQDQYYNYHQDWAIADEFKKRKLSFVLQLSDPENYSGGSLDFPGIKSSRAWREQGTLIIFPSMLTHKVSPIIEGLRHSLVGWYEGAPLK